MTNLTDPLGLAAERIADNARQTSLGTQISGWTGDQNGLRDLQVKQQEVHDRLNLGASLSTSAVPTSMSLSGGVPVSSNGSGFAFSSFGLGGIST